MAKSDQQAGRARSITELRQEIAHTRDRLAQDLSGLAYELDFPLKFRKSFQRHTATWISAAVLTGVVFVAKRTPPRRQKVELTTNRGEAKKGQEQKKGLLQAGLAMGALRFAASMLRPVVVSYVTKKVGGYAGRVR
ncbi:MAG TPA: hypothetical protein VG095_00710 [Chthoniobacterales bacterium]|nr:hypothetical protein [Chthoniobacterales bacterium]